MNTGIEKKNQKGKALGDPRRRLVALLLALVQCVSLTFAGAPTAFADNAMPEDAGQTTETEPTPAADPDPLIEEEPEGVVYTLEAVLEDQLLVTLYYDESAAIPEGAELRIRAPQLPIEQEQQEPESEAEAEDEEQPPESEDAKVPDPDPLYMSLQQQENYLAQAKRIIGLRESDLLFSLDLFELSVQLNGATVIPEAPVELRVCFLQADPSLEETFAVMHVEEDSAYEMESVSLFEDGLCTLYVSGAQLGMTAFSSCAWLRYHAETDLLDISLYGPASAYVDFLDLDIAAPEGEQVLESVCYVAQSRAPSYMTSIWADVKPLQEGEQELSLYALKGAAPFYRLSNSASTEGLVYMGQADGIALMAPAAEEEDDTLYSADGLRLSGPAPEGLEVKALDVRESFADIDLVTYFAEQSMAKRGAKSASVPKRYVLIGAYDISLLLDGKEYQPEPGQPILVSITDPAIGEGYDLQLWHIHDDGSREKVDFTVDGDTMSFWADSFSVYAALYTVDFHWGEYTCHLGGEDSILLSELLQELNVTEIGLREVTDVSFSDPDLLQVEAQEGDWLLTSLKPFQTKETLSLSLSNGETVTIAVDDAINVRSLSELTAALNNPASGATILLQEDISSDSALSINYGNENAGYTIDLGGHTLTIGGDGLSISDSNTANIQIVNGKLVSKLTAKVGGVTLGEGLTVTGNVSVTDGGKLFVDGAAVTGNVNASNGGTVTINSGSVSGDVGVSGGALSISGGTVGGDVNALNTSTTMTGGTVSGNMTITNQTAELSGGTVSGDVSMENATTTISGGTFGGTVSATGGSTTITGGAFENLPTDLLPQNVKILTIKAGSANKSYDGQPLTCDTYEAEGLAEGDTIDSITFAASQTEVGECDNVPSDVRIKRADADVTAEYIIHYTSGKLTVTQKTLTITADSASKRYDGAALTKETYSYTGLAEGDEIQSVTLSVTDAQGQPAEAVTGGEYVNVPSDAVVFDADGEDVTASYQIEYVNGTLTVFQPEITITADSDRKTYDGDPLTKDSYTYTPLYEDDSIQSVTMTVTDAQNIPTDAVNAGEYVNAPSAAVIFDANGEDVTSSYIIHYENGTLTVDPAPVTLTAISTCRNYTGSEQSVSGYSCSVPGLSFEGVSAGASATGTEQGVEYDVTFTGVTLNETRDSTGNYVVTETVEGRLLIATLLLTEPDGFEGNLTSYKVTVNPYHWTLNNSQPVTVKDTLIKKTATNGYTGQSIDYSSVTPDPAAGVSFDYSGFTGTFVIPDATTVTITYTARVLANAGTEAKFGSSTVIGLPEGEGFDEWGKVTLDRTETITPTGSDITGVGGKYTIKVFVYPDGHLETGLKGATFRLLDNNQRPIKYAKGAKSGQEVTFTTGSDGFFTVELEEDRDGVSIHKNTVYYLEMIETPVAGSGTESDPYTYFQKDNTLYNFLITDNAEYSLGDSGIYTYFNGDVLKVRCYPESVGINVTVRFTGNFTPTDAQKDAVVFVLERENTATSGWDEAERHAYSEFDYGSLRFTKGAKGWEDRDYGATYRIRVENAEVTGAYLDVNSVVSSQSSGQTISDETNEFLVDPDHEAYSFSLIFTLEYSNRTLTFYALDEESGALLPGMELSVFKAIGDQPTGITYTTAADGTTVLKRADSAQYQANVLYYVMETKAPTGYLLPDEPVKTYFYFSEGSTLVPPGLPSGETALDLSKTYSTVAIANNCVETNFPVVIAWGLSGAGTWPSDPDDQEHVYVHHVVVTLYRSVDGADPEPVAGKSVSLNKDRNFDNSVFNNLPLRITEGGVVKRVEYSLVETLYADEDGTQDVTSHYAVSDTVSGSGWHVLRNQDAVTVTVVKSWLDQSGSSAAAPEGTSALSFDLYRTSLEGDTTQTLDRGDMQSFLDSNEAVLVRSGLSLTAEKGWSLEIPSLQKTDKDEHPYYYFALEREESMPDNHEDLYAIAPAAGSDLRTLTIFNRETPITVVIQAPDNASKEYGEAEPDYTDAAGTPFAISVQDSEAVLGDLSVADGVYSFTVTKDSVIKTIRFMLSRDGGESVGCYALTPYGSTSQEGYRVVYKTGTLTITHAPVIVTAEGMTKTYGDADPKLAIVQGMKNGENAAQLIHYEVYREPGEDVETGPYDIYVSGQIIQGNYSVTYVNGALSIFPATANVKAVDVTKHYGEDDPELSVKVTGLKASDMDTVIVIGSLTREEGEDVGTYPITVTGEANQGNYIVTYAPATMTIEPAELRVTVESKEIIYGDPQPEWEVWLEGLQRDDSGDNLSTTTNEDGSITYTYTLREGQTLSFTLSSNLSGDVGEYPIALSGEASQGNYEVSFESGRLNIVRALLTVTPDDIVRNVNDPDPVLTATIEGWKNGDNLDDEGQPLEPVTSASGEVTYSLRGGKTLVFTLQRVPGTAVGDYTINASGAAYQGNYEVNYDTAVFSILSVYGIQVSQTIVDPVDASANPAFEYLAEVDLTGTGLSRLTGFDEHNQLRFTLGGDQLKVRTLQIPVGAKLTVSLVDTNSDYETGMTLDGDPYQSATNTCVIDNVDNFYYIGFEHNRICLPAVAMAAVDQTEVGAEERSPTAYIGIPADALTIDGSYVQLLQREAGYTLPTDKYFEFDHATLVNASGVTLAGCDQIRTLDYDEGKWVYKNAGDTAFSVVPDGAVLRLYYYPKYVCQIGSEKFYTLNAALAYMQDNGMDSATVEMLLENFYMPTTDVLTIPENTSITLTKASTIQTATISRSIGLSGNMFINNGELILDNIILDGSGVTNAEAMVRSAGSLTVMPAATLRNANGVNGGALAITDGTANITGGTITGNSATNGGAVHMSGGTLSISGGTITGNSAASGGAVFMTGGTLNITGGSISGNSATYGGAFYTEGGSVSISENGSVADNTAAQSGGMLFATGGNLEISGGSVTGNSALAGNGGAVCYTGPGTVTISGGAITGNIASAGNGGAIYQSSGTVTISGSIGADGNPNRAQNGSAIYVKAGTANFNACTIQYNKTTDTGSAPKGGAVGVDVEAKLYFTGNTVIRYNTNSNSSGKTANIYLDEDSDEIINVPSTSLGSSAYIGVYVADSVRTTRGGICCSFGSYVNVSNMGKFSNDRGVFSAYGYENKIWWGKTVKFSVRYVADGFPTSNTSGTQLLAAKDYYPKSATNEIYDLVTELYNAYSDLQKNIQAGYVYAYSYANSYVSFPNAITSIDWDSTNNRWSFKHNGTEVTNSGASNQFTIFYSDSSYLNITNNSDYPLSIASLTVNGYSAVTDGFGYVTAIDNVNLPSLRAITTDDLSIPAGGSVKLLFPGAKGKAWNLDGAFDFGEATNPIVVYSLNGGDEQTLTDPTVSLGDNLLSNATGIYEILFGDPISICKVGEKPFPRLTDAMDYIQSAEYNSDTATIEMLIDYQQPKDDILSIPEGYKITLTTADPKPADPEAVVEGKLYYVGEDPTRSTISRSSGEVGSAVKALIDVSEVTTNTSELTTSLTVTGIIFDGKALGQGGQGGAINTANVDVKVDNCAFKGYTAERGGAVYTKWGRLDVRNCSFDKCRVFAEKDKTGGGGVWTTAQILTVDNCVFTDCYGQGQAQGSAIFHNIRYDGAPVHPSDSQKFPTGFSSGSETYISNCQFKNCTAIGSGGTIESDAWIVEITDCYFNGSQTLKSGGNGGAINIYTNDNKNIPSTASLKISGCTFVDCSAPNGTTNGGAIRTLSPILIVEDSTFTNVHSNSVGGAISMSAVGSSIKITDSAFDGCSAGSNSGAVYANATTVEIENTTFKDCTAPSYGCIYQTRNVANSSVTVTNSSFENCVSSNSEGGAIYTVAQTLSVSGTFGGLTHNYLDVTQTAGTQSYPAQSFTFKDCSATKNGGAVYHGSGTSDTLTNCVFDGCSSGMSGGGAYLAAGTVSVSGGAVDSCKAETSGGGLYITPTTGTISNCGFSGNWVTASDGKGGSLYVNKGGVTVSGCTISDSKAAYGGGIYKTADGTTTVNLTSISDCYASYGGGIYHAGTLNVNSGSVSGCYAARGGGIYSAAALNMNGSESATVFSACYARDVTLKDDGSEPEVATSANAENLGGGIYNSAGVVTIKSSGAQITGCNAYDGGGVYLADGTFTFGGGSIDHNAASNNGGGVCLAGGSVSLSGNTADALISANTAAKGAGVFVADGLTMTANGQNGFKFEISGNHAGSLGGGIAVGGASSVLNFAGYVLVQDNTQGSARERCNVYLDQDTNSVIRTSAALNASSYIGVYVVDDLVSAHGEPGLPFGTWGDNSNLKAFRNDRSPYYPYYYGTVGASDKQIVWSKFVCKITGYNPTTGEWEMLYTAPTESPETGLPAVYPKLEGSDTGSAFGTLNVSGTPSLYLVGSSSAYNNAAGYRIEMLVQDYSLPEQASLTNNKTITLTTASTQADECGFKYDGLQNHPYATITRSKNNFRMLSCSKGKLTLSGIILDGGSNQGYTTNLAGGIVFLSGSAQLTIGSNATLRNSRSSGQAGAGVRVGNSVSDTTKLILEEGGLITNCTGASYGGGVSLKAGTFEMTGGSITDCSAQYGGGVRVDGTMTMSGGTITGNSAAKDGGGISFNSDNGTVAKVNFSGNPVVKGNTLDGSPFDCDVQLTLNSNKSNEVIFSNGLEEGAEIGVYTPGSDTDTNSMFYKHGLENKPFGTWTSDTCLFGFFNDRTGLVGGKMSDDKIYWLGKPMIEINLTVKSDWSRDLTTDFAFTVKIEGYENYVSSAELVSYEFSSQGERTVHLKNGEMVQVSLPVKLLGQQTRVSYTVTETVEADYFDTTVENRRNTDPIGPIAGTSVGGILGENVSADDEGSTSTSKLYFVNTRKTGDVTVSKFVESKEEADKTKAYRFTLTLAEEIVEDEIEGKTFVCVDADDEEIADGLTFKDHAANFTLQHGQSITVKGLPLGIGYTVAEELSGPSETKFIQTRISKNGSESSEAADSATGKVGENELRSVKFINIKRDVVCKITNSNGELLYYKDSGEEVEAIFYRVEDAFAQVNSGGLHTVSGGSASGVLHIEMVVPEYAMEGPATLNSGRTVLLTTADKVAADGRYPYQGEEGVPSVISRGFTDGSMITSNGNLTLDNITLDGAASAYTANCDGGIIHVNNSRLTVESGATLQNSDVGAHNGGGIWSGAGGYITVRGTVDGCSAKDGGGIYAGNRLSGLSVNGTLSNNTASGNGGAICVESDAASAVNVNLYSSTLSGNHAGGNGGAVYSELNVIVRNTTETVSTLSNNSANGDGGAIYMGAIADDPSTAEDESYLPTFSMSGGLISGNSATNGGALVIQGVSRISGGSLSNNTATANGGVIYTTPTANVTISGSGTSFSGNSAARGGVVYDQGEVTMSGGSMTGNTGTVAGSAVYVGGGHSFTMSNGSITGNSSPAGAVSSDPTDDVTHPATLTFSGNAVIHENTSPDLQQGYYMDVYLGLDSDLLINTPGLGSGAHIGIYVANGEQNNILYEHGIANCNFGTYTGTNPENAGLNHFFNDRYPELYGVDGRLETEGVDNAYFIMWKGKDLRLVVYQFDVQTNEKGEPLRDGEGHYLPIENSAENAITEASFRLVNITDADNVVEVWTGKSDSEGRMTIPWGKIEEYNHATFLRRNTYKLEQLSTNDESLLPGGYWTITVAREGTVTWLSVKDDGNPNRVKDMGRIPATEDGLITLDDEFIVYNDRYPKIVFNANGGRMQSEDKAESVTIKMDEVTDTSKDYTITESNPTWNTKFLDWEDKDPKSEGDETHYKRLDEIKAERFYRTSDFDDLLLYANWETIVCKITDRDDNLLYLNGDPCIYHTLEEAFEVFNKTTRYQTYSGANSRYPGRKIQMLVDSYELTQPLTLDRSKTLVLTTATSDPPPEEHDVYLYYGESWPCTITRGFDGGSMITNLFNLTLSHITLDGGGSDYAVSANGGIVNVDGNYAQLILIDGATLQNSVTTGLGGAIYAAENPTINLTVLGGSVVSNSASQGGGIYLSAGTSLAISGRPDFGGSGVIVEENVASLDTTAGNFATGVALAADAKNGDLAYTRARQDIFIAGYENTDAPAMTVDGNISSGDGTIWVWAEETPHYVSLQQFAKYTENVTDTETTFKAFRNARPDAETGAAQYGEYLYGITLANDSDYNVFWYGIQGTREVVIRKVTSSYVPLSGAVFEIYMGDAAACYVDEEGQTLQGLVSEAHGIIWVGPLPYALYYVHETQKADGSPCDLWFYFDVGDTVKMSGEYGSRAAAKAAYNDAKNA